MGTRDSLGQLHRLVELLGSQASVARLLGTDPPRITGWLGSVAPRAQNVRQIADAYSAVECLLVRVAGDIPALRAVLETPTSEYGGERPSDLIRNGRASEILSAAPSARLTRDGAEQELIDALVSLAGAARASADALKAARA